MPKALVTGASRGIGQAVARGLTARGLEVLAPSREEVDLADPAAVSAYGRTLPEGISVLVNCAGINDLAGVEEMTDESIARHLQVNLAAQLQLIRAVTPGMKAQKYGRIVNFSSIWSVFSKPRRIIYGASKGGVNALTAAAAVELGPYNILVNAVAPGFIATQMTSQNNTPAQIAELAAALPLKRLGTPEEVAELVCFLASEQNGFITGQTIFIDGGFSCQ